jgi:hypothetical protein
MELSPVNFLLSRIRLATPQLLSCSAVPVLHRQLHKRPHASLGIAGGRDEVSTRPLTRLVIWTPCTSNGPLTMLISTCVPI